MELVIEGGRALIGEDLVETPVAMSGGSLVETPTPGSRRFDARGLLVMPGLIDVHGDAFERQIMPRPGVSFDLDIALHDSDRQVIANGITTVFHGVTWSWEPGLRGAASALALLEAIERLRPDLAADTQFHLRHETYNLEGEAEITTWLARGRVGVLAFNDHTPEFLAGRKHPSKFAQLVERTGLSEPEILALMDQVATRADEVPASIQRLAAAAVAAGIPVMSHDDRSPAERRWYRALGCTVCEFPKTVAAATEAVFAGEATVFGAPNVLRGGSHTGCPSAAEMVARGFCTVLASDYYYPAMLHAPFRLAEDGVLPLERAWSLVSSGAARALGLADRGTIAPGLRADLVIVDAASRRKPRVVATLVEGHLVHLTEPERLVGAATTLA